MSWPTESARRQVAIRVAICTLLAAALHLALLAVWSSRPLTRSGSGGSSTAHSATIRLAPENAPVADDSPEAPELPGAVAEAPHDTAASAPTSQASAPAAAAGSSASSPGAGMLGDVERIDGIDYLPRPWLSEAPAARQRVVLPRPELHGDTGSYRTELSLFIDADGEVRHVRVDGAPLPEALETAVREAFIAVRFVPGRIDGQPVASRFRIQVELGRPPS